MALLYLAIGLLVCGAAALLGFPRKTARRVRWIVGGLLFIVSAPVLFLYSPWLYSTFECGHQPLYASEFAGANYYSFPGEPNYKRITAFNTYLCTEEEAKEMSYVHISGREPEDG